MSMMRDLPFLNGVRALEAAARHGGFAKAADELHVTAPAVSRMVKLLEE
jgi:LysR family glycine cleavage system transcriptional activator